jgi:uncharacterized protein YjbI with pentapeptide repeats
VPRKTTIPKAWATLRQWWIGLIRKKNERIGTLEIPDSAAAVKLGSPPLTGRKRRDLRKPSPDLISKARDETATQVTRLGLTFVGTAAFCLLSLLSPDSALLGGSEKINVPFAGPVSFFGFMLLGPVVLIALRVYLQIYVEHSARLDQLARSVSPVRAPNLLPLQNSLVRIISGLIFYALLPVAMVLFTWKAAVFRDWGVFLFGVAVAVITSHVLMLFPSRLSWRKKALSWRRKAALSVIVAYSAALLVGRYVPLERRLDLYRANLSDHWLKGEQLFEANLSGANLTRANLSDAYLGSANLSYAGLIDANVTDAFLVRANLFHANLSGANLSDAFMWWGYLTEANMTGAKLSGTRLFGAELTDANMTGAKLSGAGLHDANLTRTNLSHAELHGAYLGGADLDGADLSGADLSGANLTDVTMITPNKLVTSSGDAKNLTQTQLDKACGNADTKLPNGLTLKLCPTK